MRKLTDAERRDIALTIAGEIHPGLSRYGTEATRREIAAILGVIENRSALDGKSVSDIVHADKQFSTWNTDEDKQRALTNYADYKSDIDKAIDDYFSGYLESPVPDATQYYAPGGMKGKVKRPK